MTKNNNNEIGSTPGNTGVKPSNRILKKLFWLILAIVIIFIAAKIHDEYQYKKAAKLVTPDQLSNIETQIFDINSNADNNGSIAISSEGDTSLIKQKLQIEELQKQLQILQIELDKLKNQDKLPKIIIALVELQNQFELGKNYDGNLSKLEALSASDLVLNNKIEKLKAVLKNSPKHSREISNNFAGIIPQIIALKYSEPQNTGIIGKIWNNISKLITIRRIDGIVKKPKQNVDFIILQTEKLIAEEKYEQALNLLSTLGQDYQPVLVKVNFDLQNAADFQKVNSEILSYLKELSNV